MFKNKKGTALVYALGVISFISILLTGLVQLIVSQAKFGHDAVDREKAFQIAEACSQQYRWYLAHNTDGKTVDQVQEFWEQTGADEPRGLSADYPWDIKNSDGTMVIGKCRAKIITPGVNANTPVNVKFEGYSIDNVNIKRQIKVRYRRTSWSDYVVLSNEHASFDSDWDIKGRIMSNTGVKFDGVVHGRVYAGSSNYFDPVSGMNKPGVWTSHAIDNTHDPVCELNVGKNSCVFLGGKRFPIPQKDFQGIAVDLNAMRNTAQYPSNGTTDGCNYTGKNNCYFPVPVGKVGMHVTLKGDGTFDIVVVKEMKNSSDIKTEDNGSRRNRNIPHNGIIFVGGNVWVDGEVNSVSDRSRVTIVAGEGMGNIYVGNGNLRYNNKDGSEAVGLIAKGNILLTSTKKDCPNDETCDLEIDAAMVAKDGMVGKEDYNSQCCGDGCERQKNRLDIYGSVVSNRFIEFTVTKEKCPENKVGFKIKNIEYDNYLYLNPPPYFPSDVFYTVDLWEELEKW